MGNEPAYAAWEAENSFVNGSCIARNFFGDLIKLVGCSLLSGLSITVIVTAGLDAVRGSGPNLAFAL